MGAARRSLTFLLCAFLPPWPWWQWPPAPPRPEFDIALEGAFGASSFPGSAGYAHAAEQLWSAGRPQARREPMKRRIRRMRAAEPSCDTSASVLPFHVKAPSNPNFLKPDAMPESLVYK